jgi:phosphoserine aminotransferase
MNLTAPVHQRPATAAVESWRTAPAAWGHHEELERSLRCLEQALSRNPSSLELRFQRACTLQALGCRDQFQSEYLEIIKRDPTHLGSLVNLGRHLASQHKSGAARLLFSHAVAHHPESPECHLHLGLIHYQAKEHSRARDRLQTALRLAPDHQLAHFCLSFVLQELGDETGAATHRRLGLKGRCVIALPYYGKDAPVVVVKLTSATTGNAPVERFLDDRTFQIWIVVPEFYDPRQPLPPHQLVFNAIGDFDAVPGALRAAESVLALTSARVINQPAAVAQTGRCANWSRLAGLPGVVAPLACMLPARSFLTDDIEQVLAQKGILFPILVRSPGYHTGEHFVQARTKEELSVKLAGLPGSDLIAMQFMDLREPDGKVRKYRVMIIDGQLYPLHAAISYHWKVHYFSADMVDCGAHRQEDARFLEDMPRTLGEPALKALHGIAECLGLDYAGIDFSLTAAREVVVWEANATMVVPPPDPDPRWDYRRGAVERIDKAVRRMLLARAGRMPAGPEAAPAPSVPLPTLPRNALNFSAGPGALPEEVLQQAQQAIIALPETGLSVLGMSHRSAWFEAILTEAHGNLRELLAIPSSHQIVFMQGGSSLQFSMIPMNFARSDGPRPAYVRSGYWSAKAIEEAHQARPLREAWSGADDGYRCLPEADDLVIDDDAPYLHYVSNETVEGLQFKRTPHPSDFPHIPLIADMSSDFLSRPVDFGRHAMVYAHAQKNLGPAGVTVCVIRNDLLERVPEGLPPMLDYRTHVRCGSNYNTPPVFAIYVLTLVTRWLRDRIGGIGQIGRITDAKSTLLYATLDRLGDQVRIHAKSPYRSTMNVSFRLGDARLESRLVEEAEHAGFTGLAGHRSLGGIRVSLYNAVNEAAVSQLCEFLTWFVTRRG